MRHRDRETQRLAGRPRDRRVVETQRQGDQERDETARPLDWRDRDIPSDWETMHDTETGDSDRKTQRQESHGNTETGRPEER